MQGRLIVPILIAAGTIFGWLAVDFFMGPASERNVSDERAILMAGGQQLYLDHCLTCHQAAGGGVPNLQPSLAGSELVIGGADELIRFVRSPPDNPESAYENTMPPFEFMNDQELSAILTYIRASFGNAAPPITPETMAWVRAAQ